MHQLLRARHKLLLLPCLLPSLWLGPLQLCQLRGRKAGQHILPLAHTSNTLSATKQASQRLLLLLLWQALRDRLHGTLGPVHLLLGHVLLRHVLLLLLLVHLLLRQLPVLLCVRVGDARVLRQLCGGDAWNGYELGGQVVAQHLHHQPLHSGASTRHKPAHTHVTKNIKSSEC